MLVDSFLIERKPYTRYVLKARCLANTVTLLGWLIWQKMTNGKWLNRNKYFLFIYLVCPKDYIVNSTGDGWSIYKNEKCTFMLVCLVCQKGYRVNDAGDGCVICPNNTYSDTIDAESCKQCARNTGDSHTRGQVSGTGSTSSSDCCKKLYIYFF